MKLLGYSERGILNALLYEIHHSGKGDALLKELIAEAVFPVTNLPCIAADPVFTVFIEQSLSNFGNADAIILGQSEMRKYTIFVEAKVSAQSNNWRLEKEFADFKKGLVSKVKYHSSNLFTQIYHKQQFMEHTLDKLKSGVPFPKWSKNRRRKIGTNPTVLRAAEQIKQHCDTTFYLMLIPENDDDDAVKDFFKNTLCNTNLPNVPGWDVSHYGYLTWQQVKDFCDKQPLQHSLAVFQYNDKQIYWPRDTDVIQTKQSEILTAQKTTQHCQT